MGLRDIITGRHTVKGPAPDKLFAIATAYIALESEHSIAPAGVAAIVFQALATSEFEATIREMEDVVKATGGESGTTVATQDDSYGYRWMVLRNPDGKPSVEDLAVGINAVASSIETAGHGERLLCAVFAFADAQKRRVYFIYNYKRGYWYPFIPADGNGPPATALAGGEAAAELSRSDPPPSAPGSESGQRATERELQLKAQMASELPIEPELERWFPLWGIPI
jgi:hypothetical protein